MFKGDEPPVTLQYHLGPLSQNTTYEAEAVGITLGLQLLRTVGLPARTTLSLDNQGVMQASATYKQRQSHYILDMIHRMTRAINRNECNGGTAFSLEIAWISGHSGTTGNELVDKAAKDAVLGTNSANAKLPKFLREMKHGIPASASALKQVHRRGLKLAWAAKWAESPRHGKFKKFADNNFAAYRSITKDLTRAQASLMIQLRLEHVVLNQYLCRIGAVDSPLCDRCNEQREETVQHFIFDCPEHYVARRRAKRALGGEEYNTETLFSTRAGIKLLLSYVNETERLKHIFGEVGSANLQDEVEATDEPPEWGDDYDWDDINYMPVSQG